MFNLHTLGWHSFQELCHSILKEVLGQTVESFLDGNDGGRDGAFSGTWTTDQGEDLSGRFVVQCKFTSRAGYGLKPSDLADEFSKVARLVNQGRCDAYVLMTNAGVTGETVARIEDELLRAGVSKSRVLGQTWIEHQIRESTTLRMMVPRLYGLGDLTQILDERAYRQAAAVLESMRDDLAKVVITNSYQKAAKALSAHRFVLLIGEPAAGKTTIASMLAMAAADKWKALVVKADTPAAVTDHWNPDESQLFWIDDAFGVTQFESSLVKSWNHILPQMKSMLDRGSSIVMTSRDYIYQQARRDLKEGAFPLFQESQTVVDVHDLTAAERDQILYNHIKLGRQPQEFRREVKRFLPQVARHRRFIPEIARRLANPFFTKRLYLADWAIDQFVERRESFLVEVCNGLDSNCKAALALIYMRRSKLHSPIELAPAEDEAIRRLDSSLGACSRALEVLEGSLIVHMSIDGESYWSFKHPTIGDAYSSILRESPELLGIYLRGADVDKMLGQVTCGDAQIKGAVVLPKSLFGLVIERLIAYEASSSYRSEHLSTWFAKRNVKHFLAKRCNAEFVSEYLNADPDLLEAIAEPRPPLEYSDDADLAVRLFELGLLPEKQRQRIAATLIELATEGEDAGVLSDERLSSILNAREQSRLKHAMRTELLPRIAEVRVNLQAAHEEDEDAEWHMRRFNQILDALRDQYPGSQRIHNAVKRERVRVQEWIEQREAPPELVRRKIGAEDSQAIPASERAIFEDVDE